MDKIHALFLEILIAVLVLSFAGPGAAYAKTLKQYDFEDRPPGEWSPQGTKRIGGSKALGLFNNRNRKYFRSASLDIEDIPAGSGVRVEFDLILVGNWESQGHHLADRFTVRVKGGDILLDMTSFPCKIIDEDELKPVGNNGTVQVKSRLLGYWVVPCRVDVPASMVEDGQATLVFRGRLSGRGTEFWALDNLRVVIPD